MGKGKNLVSGVLFIIIVYTITIFMFIPEKGSCRLTRREIRIIDRSDSVMYVLNVSNPEDSVILRTKCDNFTDADLRSVEYVKLSRKMLHTLKSPQQDGVGLAAPQVGINHRLIAVCRMDKEGEPYELYPNIKIDSLFGEVSVGAEGCLSIPPYRGMVPRYSDIIISYKDINSMTTVTEHISGYTAVIFQHECDHLDGILYTDKAESVTINEEWEKEREEYEKLGLYKRPDWF